MSESLVLEGSLCLGRRGQAGGQERPGGGRSPEPAPATARAPRIARLMALALRLETLVQEGTVGSYAELARLGHVSRARLSQILSLLSLAPDLQEALLFWERPRRGREPLTLCHLLPITAILDWQEQRRRWRQLRRRSPRHAW
jgi:hypothetical protein